KPCRYPEGPGIDTGIGASLGPGTQSGQMRSLSPLRGRILMALRAGLALIMIGCLVAGLKPGRALVAGLCTTLILSRLGTLTTPDPFLPRCLPASSRSASKTDDTCFLLSPVFSARAPKNSVLVAGLTADLSAVAG